MKSNEALYKAIGEIREEYIPDMDKRKRKPIKWAVIGGLTAAAVALGIFLTQGARLINTPVKEWEPIFPASCYDPGNTFAATEKIPFQNVEYRIIVDSLSSSGIDLSQDNGNPWREETAPEALPMFKRLDFYGRWDNYIRRYFTEEQLREIAEKAAAALDLSVTQSHAVYDREGYSYRLDYVLAEYFRENNFPMYFKAECNGERYGKEAITITVDSGSISVIFSDMNYDAYAGYQFKLLPLPENSSVSWDASEEELQRAVEYLIENFNDLLQYNNPTIGTQLIKLYSEDIMKRRDFRLFNMTDNDILNILNYNLSYMTFSGDNETNSIYDITVNNNLSVMEYLGDYPVMSPDEVREMLINDGYYLYDETQGYTKVDDEVKAEEIKKIELLYNEVTYTGYSAPYYKIYIEAEDLKESNEPGYRYYRTLYVPAVREEYFESPPKRSNIDLNEEVLNAIPDDLVKFPDGSQVSKESAVAANEDARFPELEFDFAFIRFAKPKFLSTLDDPDCYDFEKGEGKETLDLGVNQNEWCRIKKGDMIAGTGDLSVKYAETKARWYGDGQDLYESKVVFDGTVTVEGIFYYTGDYSRYRSVMFFPTPSNGWTVPMLYSPYRDPDWIVTEDGEAFITDSNVFWINFAELPDCFNEKRTVKVKATLENITLSYNESADGFSAKLKDFEIIE